VARRTMTVIDSVPVGSTYYIHLAQKGYCKLPRKFIKRNVTSVYPEVVLVIKNPRYDKRALLTPTTQKRPLLISLEVLPRRYPLKCPNWE